ncbi:MAG TPA: cell wall-binding repeat-containing protein [Egibacteraceae bacterium]|nr:cell wall-binding repeat-containing protein [Egibacteraceae bacterium]
MTGRVVAAIAMAVVLAVSAGGPAHGAQECPSGPVALTFDDGPGVHTPAVLDALADRNVPATFFTIGERIDQSPHLVQDMAALGHVVANHTYRHENLTHLSDEHIRVTVSATTAAIQRAGVRAAPLVRPPNGATNASVRSVLEHAGYAHVLWSIDPQDWRGHSAATIASHVLTHMTAGGVVVLHDGSPRTPNTVGALPRIIDEGRARGFCFGVLDDAGRVTVPAPSPPPEQVAPPQQVDVIAGRDRYATGVAVSRAIWPGTVPAVVLAEGDAWPDAVSGSALAATLGGPLLLTRRDRLDPAVADELGRLTPEVAYVLGPIETSVENELWLMNIEARRLRGPDRYATSELIAEAAAANGAETSTVLVATGRRFPDGLAGSVLAAGQRHPILLTRETGDRQRLGGAIDRLGAQRTWVFGGPGAVPETAVAGLPGLERIAGSTRTATAAAVADRAVTLGYDRRPLVASGWRHPDGLTGSGLAAARRRPILLTAPSSLSPDVHDWIKRHGSTHATVLGGPAAIGSGALCQLRTGLDRPTC